ncbi:hypothetical protein FGIG_07423 [Fasciola gigantica]|uniref:Uncharacterized protein n=1 Tax=Fasciola gigantica TaxID=46835 RepID=A0A504YJY3_FASGI|nr:hypothetical protein FGIG_07423 [Fasciola gigantica]
MEALFITTNTGSVELRVKCTVHSLDKLFERGELFCLFDNLKAILETTAELIAVHTQESNEQATKKLLNELTFGTKMCRNGELPCRQGNKRIFSFLNAADQSDEFTVQQYFAFFSPSKSLRGWGQFMCSDRTKRGWKFGILKTNSSSLFHRTKIPRQQSLTVQQSLSNTSFGILPFCDYFSSFTRIEECFEIDCVDLQTRFPMLLSFLRVLHHVKDLCELDGASMGWFWRWSIYIYSMILAIFYRSKSIPVSLQDFELPDSSGL